MARTKQEATPTWGIPPKVRKAIRSFVLEARGALEEDFRRQLAALGITPSATGQVPESRTLSERDQRVREAATAVIERLISAKASQPVAFEVFVRESAYTFLNRMVGLRCLEERGLLIVDGRRESVIREDRDLRASSLYFRVRSELSDDAAPREVWGETLKRATQAVSGRIGAFFDPDSEYGRLLPLQSTLTALIDGLNDEVIPAEVYSEDEFLGWVYQYYNAEEKDSVYSKLGKGGKIERPEELAAASCLYTERYMVDFLLQNTLGALWTRIYPETRLPETWPYYVRPPEQHAESTHENLPSRVRDITLLDPAVGSGHFLVRAFDLFVQMYKDEGIENPQDIPKLILERNLHGIDIDPRAAQISALALYLKGCDMVGPDFRPTRINLVSADVLLPGAPPASLIDRYTGELDIQELMRTIWAELKNAPMLGSLLHPERKIDELLQKRRRDGNTLLQQDDAAWERFKLELLQGLREEFEREAQSEDIGKRLFGENLAKTISLVEALSRHNDVVVANPPYAGSRGLAESVKRLVDAEYSEGKHDLYAAFILRCMEFARPGGCVGMVTQQSWMFLRSFSRLRLRVLGDASINQLAHLGPRAFEEIGGEVVSVGLFTLTTGRPHPEHRWSAFRLVGSRSPGEKNQFLLDSVTGEISKLKHTPRQADILAIPEAPFVYWLRPRFFQLLSSKDRLEVVADVRQGLATSDNDRFVRFIWEVPRLALRPQPADPNATWFPFAKGGGFAKWLGFEMYAIDWWHDGERLKQLASSLYVSWSRTIKNVSYYFKPGLTYSLMARGSMGVRVLEPSVFDVAGMSIFPKASVESSAVSALLNTHLASFLLRVTTQDLKFHAGYVAGLPLPDTPLENLEALGTSCTELKRTMVIRDPRERLFFRTQAEVPGELFAAASSALSTQALLHSLEGVNERLVCDAYELDTDDVSAIVLETGVPAGWHPLISGYDKLPPVPEGIDLPTELVDFLDSHERSDLAADDISALKDRLRARYEAGSAKEAEGETVPEIERALIGARIPIPSETFLEELSADLRIHPISIYNLLKEMREEEGLVSLPLMKEAFEDFASVVILRLVGYRWPHQDVYEREHTPIIPLDLVEQDGIIPLVQCNDEKTAADRVRTSLEREFGEDGAARIEDEFRTWTGRKLEGWLAKEFFKRHMTQFKRRPIAWHLSSQEGTFQAFVLYHKLSKATLERIKNLYAAGLIRRLKGELQRAQARGDSSQARQLALQIEDVEDFIERIQDIEEGRTLEGRIRCRWKDEGEEGRLGPYAPDIDDGVKVNIRPFQEMGLLARRVISKW